MNFSVLMSIYIKEKASFLNECFESIWIKQCFKPNEIVVVLDGPITPDLSKVLIFWKSILNDVDTHLILK